MKKIVCKLKFKITSKSKIGISIIIALLLLNIFSEQVVANQKDSVFVTFKKNSKSLTSKSKKTIKEFIELKIADSNYIVSISYSQPLSCVKSFKAFDKLQSISKILVNQGINKDNIEFQYYNQAPQLIIILIWKEKEVKDTSIIPPPPFYHKE